MQKSSKDFKELHRPSASFELLSFFLTLARTSQKLLREGVKKLGKSAFPKAAQFNRKSTAIQTVSRHDVNKIVGAS